MSDIKFSRVLDPGEMTDRRYVFVREKFNIVGYGLDGTVYRLTEVEMLDAYMRSEMGLIDDDVTGLPAQALEQAYRSAPEFNKTGPIQDTSERPTLNA